MDPLYWIVASCLSGVGMGAVGREVAAAFIRSRWSREQAGAEAAGRAVSTATRPALACTQQLIDAAPAAEERVIDTWAAPDDGRPRPRLEIVAESTAAPTPRPSLREIAIRPAADHAEALLDFLRGPGGATGEILAVDVEGAYTDLMMELGWQPRPWNTVARALREALGDNKTYAWRNGHRIRVYRIPPAAPLRAAA